jgi:hypothetical protein
LLEDLDSSCLNDLSEQLNKNSPAFIKTLPYFNNLKRYFENKDDNIIFLIVLLFLKDKLEKALVKQSDEKNDVIITILLKIKRYVLIPIIFY